MRQFIPILLLIVLLGGISLFGYAVIKAFRSKAPGWIATAVLLAVVLPLIVVMRVAHNTANIKDAIKECVSADGRFAITVQSEWQPRWGHYNEGCIQAADPINGRYTVLIADNKEASKGTLEQYASATAKRVADTMEHVHQGSGFPTNVAGFPAIQYRIEGRRKDVDVVFFHTSIDAGTTYAQLLCWCAKPDEAAATPVFEDLASSFEHMSDVKR